MEFAQALSNNLALLGHDDDLFSSLSHGVKHGGGSRRPLSLGEFLLQAPQNSAEAEARATRAILFLLKVHDPESASALEFIVNAESMNTTTSSSSSSSSSRSVTALPHAQAAEFRRRAVDLLNATLKATEECEVNPGSSAGNALTIRLSDLQRCTGERFVKLLWRVSSRVLRTCVRRAAWYQPSVHGPIGGDPAQNAAWRAALMARNGGSNSGGDAVDLVRRAAVLRGRCFERAFNSFRGKMDRERERWQEADDRLSSEAETLKGKLAALKARNAKMREQLRAREAVSGDNAQTLAQKAAEVSQMWKAFMDHHARNASFRAMTQLAVEEPAGKYLVNGDALRSSLSDPASQQGDVDLASLISSWSTMWSSDWQKQLSSSGSSTSVGVERMNKTLHASLQGRREQVHQATLLNQQLASILKHRDFRPATRPQSPKPSSDGMGVAPATPPSALRFAPVVHAETSQQRPRWCLDPKLLEALTAEIREEISHGMLTKQIFNESISFDDDLHARHSLESEHLDELDVFHAARIIPSSTSFMDETDFTQQSPRDSSVGSPGSQYGYREQSAMSAADLGLEGGLDEEFEDNEEADSSRFLERETVAGPVEAARLEISFASEFGDSQNDELLLGPMEHDATEDYSEEFEDQHVAQQAAALEIRQREDERSRVESEQALLRQQEVNRLRREAEARAELLREQADRQRREAEAARQVVLRQKQEQEERLRREAEQTLLRQQEENRLRREAEQRRQQQTEEELRRTERSKTLVEESFDDGSSFDEQPVVYKGPGGVARVQHGPGGVARVVRGAFIPSDSESDDDNASTSQRSVVQGDDTPSNVSTATDPVASDESTLDLSWDEPSDTMLTLAPATEKAAPTIANQNQEQFVPGKSKVSFSPNSKENDDDGFTELLVNARRLSMASHSSARTPARTPLRTSARLNTPSRRNGGHDDLNLFAQSPWLAKKFAPVDSDDSLLGGGFNLDSSDTDSYDLLSGI